MKIGIHSEIKEVKDRTISIKKITGWVCKELDLPIHSLDVIFVDDNKLKKIHSDFLNKNSYTDVITFNLSENHKIEGEIYISFDRAKQQAKQYNVSLMNEIIRLIIHGCLHLAGYDDLRKDKRDLMKQKENFYVNKAEMLLLS